MSAVKQELDLLLKGYVQRSSKLPESYKNEFKELPSFEERLEYLVIDDPDSRRIIEQIIAAFERIEKQQQSMDTGYSPRGLLEVGEALKHCLNNNLFTAYQKGLDEGRFLVINTDEFQYPLTQIDFARTSGRDEVELEEDLVFLIYLNRCPSLAKADIDSRFDGELTRVEGILNSKGVLSSEDKETLDILRTNMNFYRAENSLLGKRVIARLEESLNSDFKALIDDREMSAADKLNKIFEEFYPKYFPESFPVLQELSQSLERGCFELLMSGIDLSSVSKDLRDAFLEHLQDAELSIRSHRSGRSESSVESRFLKIAKENPEYFRHLRRLTLGSDDVAGYYLYAFLVSPEARLTFPNLKELQLNKDQLFTHDDPSQSGTTHLLKIIQNIPTLKSVKLQSVTSMLQRSKPVNIDYDALKSKFPPALRAEVNLDIKPIRFQNNCFFYEAIITIGERAE